MKYKSFYMTICFALLANPFMAHSQTIENIRFMTENYPPYNYEEKGQLKGIAVDLLLNVFKVLENNKTVKDIELLPWARGYSNVLEKEATCLFSTTRTTEREELFSWAGPISPTTISLIAKKESNITINSVEDMKKYTIGVVRDDIGEQLLVALGIEIDDLDRVEGSNVISQSIHKLNLGRIDIWSYEQNVAMWGIKDEGFNPDDYEVVYKLKKADLYFAFHKKTPQNVLNGFQQILDDLKKDGIHTDIINSYLK